jgi:cell division control protein 45
MIHVCVSSPNLNCCYGYLCACIQQDSEEEKDYKDDDDDDDDNSNPDEGEEEEADFGEGDGDGDGDGDKEDNDDDADADNEGEDDSIIDDGEEGEGDGEEGEGEGDAPAEGSERGSEGQSDASGEESARGGRKRRKLGKGKAAWAEPGGGDVEPARGGSGEDEDEDEGGVVIGRRRATLAAAFDPLVRRRKLLRQYYNQSSSHSNPTAVLLIFLVEELSRPVTPDIMWQAIIGVTDHYLRANLADEMYNSICEAIKTKLPDDTRRFRVGEGNDEVIVPGAEAGVVAAGLEYPFFLYRHWSLYESMMYSDYICTKLSSHKSKGVSRLQELLARMGIPLQQCKQNYSFMSPELRAHFRKELLGPVSAEFGLQDPPPLFKSFYRYNAFKNPIAAADVVFAVSALIESAGFPTSLLPASAAEGTPFGDDDRGGGGEDKDGYVSGTKTWMQAFNEGYDCLSMRPESDDLLKKGVTDAISLQKVINVRNSFFIIVVLLVCKLFIYLVFL